MTIAYNEFLALFPDKPRIKAGNGWLVICPAHNDHTPSLWITPLKNPDFIIADFSYQAKETDNLKKIATSVTYDCIVHYIEIW